MNWAHVQDWPVARYGGSTPLQSGSVSTVTAGNTIFVQIAVFHQVSISTVSDSTDNDTTKYVKVASANSGAVNGRAELWMRANCNGGSTVTITATPSGGTSGMEFIASEFSGGDTSGTQDGAGSTNAPAASNAPSPGTFSTTETNSLIFVGFGANTASGTPTATEPSGYTRTFYEGDANTYLQGGFSYLITTSAQTNINPAYALSNTPTWVCQAAAFKAAVGGGAAFLPAAPFFANQAVKTAAYY